ncbi:TetR/AcrR family transcriptional regulator [Peribacillus butanolivorans]|uniref:TetR/AcrR family transcriptional regulator n=2 Tax=Peribacillus butanolivorans TaxID=421767 RepID=UPI003631B2E0
MMAPKSDEQFKIIRDQRYEEISKAALKVFARKGFAATKISDITSSVKLSHGLFYHYFQSKENIYLSLIMNILDQFIETVKEAENRTGTPWDQLAWFTELTFSGSPEQAQDRRILVIEAQQSDSLSDEVKQELNQKYTIAMNGIARIISNGQREGIFIDGDPMELAIYYISLNQGLLLWNAKGFNPVKISVEKVMRHLQV